MISRKNTALTTREHSVSRALVFKWHRRFSDGQDSLEEQKGHGRKGKKTFGATIVTSIHDVLVSDRRLAIMELVQRFDLSNGTIQRILFIRPYMLQMVSHRSEYSELL